MIALLIAYIIFQIVFDHWSSDTVSWKVIYFAFQYGWVAAVAVVEMFRSKEKVLLLILAMMMSFLMINEISYLNSDYETYAMMSSDPPAYALTIVAVLLFLTYEIIIRWRNR